MFFYLFYSNKNYYKSNFYLDQQSNMKFLSFSYLLVVFTMSISSCPSYQVTNVNGVCIQPFYIQGCKNYIDVDKCAACKGYQLASNSKCSILNPSSPRPIVGCLQDAHEICSNCATGFKLENGICKKGVLFCESYRSDGTCSKCNNNFSLILNQCKKSYILGCKIVNPDNNQLCDQCNVPFTKTSGGKCIIEQCKSYNDYGCTHCQCYYGLKKDGTCQKLSRHCLKNNQGKCAFCLKNYQLNNENKCIMIGCASQDPNGICNQCMPGFILTKGNNSNQFFCKRQNCRISDNAVCKICEQGYNLVQGFCVKYPQISFTCKA